MPLTFMPSVFELFYRSFLHTYLTLSLLIPMFYHSRRYSYY